MKKYSLVVLLCFTIFTLIYLNINLSDVKPVTGTMMQTVNYSEQINVSGEFESQDKTNIMLSLPVYIKDVYVKENDFVNRGQALFSIDKEKMVEFYSGKLTEDIFEQINIDDVASLLNKTNQSSATNIYNLPDTIYASSDGIVSKVSIYSGGIALPNQQLVVLNHTDKIVAKFTLSQIDYGKISIGDTVDIVPVAFQNKKYKGVINSQNAVVKKQTTAVGNKVVIDVFATIYSPDGKVSDGLQINGVIQSGEPIMLKALDYSYINQDEKGQYVFILDNAVAEKVYIKTGIETDNYTEILTLFPKDTVFITGKNLNTGDRVILAE